MWAIIVAVGTAGADLIVVPRTAPQHPGIPVRIMYGDHRRDSVPALVEKSLAAAGDAAARALGDKRNEGAHLGNLGIAYSDLEQVERAIAYYEQALVIAREIGDSRADMVRGWLDGLG